MTETLDPAFVISIAVSIAVIGTFVVTLRSHKQENKKTYSEMTTRISSDFLRLTDEAKDILDWDSLSFWTQKYLNYCEILAHLLKNEKIDKDIRILFVAHLHDAYNSGISMEKKFPRYKIDITAPFLKEWCEKNPNKTNPFPNTYVQIDTKLTQNSV